MNNDDKNTIDAYFLGMKFILGIRKSFDLLIRLDEFGCLLSGSYDSLYEQFHTNALAEAYVPVSRALRAFKKLDSLIPNIVLTPEFRKLEEAFNEYMAFFQDLAKE